MGALDLDYPRALLVALVAVVLVALVVAGATSSSAFGAFNSSWDGASALRDHADGMGVEPAIVRDVSRFGSGPAGDSLGVVLSPDDPYSPAELDRFDEFVRGGGTLLVAEDYGRNTNPLLVRLGADARIDGRPLRDDRHNYKSAALPVATGVSNDSLVAGVDSLTLNHGTVVRPNGVRVLVNSSSYSYLDVNGNAQLDSEETIGGYPVATVERVGEGRVVVVSDPSVFINAMLDRPGNAAFASNLLKGHERVLIDASGAGGVPPLMGLLLTLRESWLLQVLVGLAGLGLIAYFARESGVPTALRERFGRSEPADGFSLTSDEMAAAIRTRHPDWDDERVRRVARRYRRSGGDESAAGRE